MRRKPEHRSKSLMPYAGETGDGLWIIGYETCHLVKILNEDGTDLEGVEYTPETGILAKIWRGSYDSLIGVFQRI